MTNITPDYRENLTQAPAGALDVGTYPVTYSAAGARFYGKAASVSTRFKGSGLELPRGVGALSTIVMKAKTFSKYYTTSGQTLFANVHDEPGYYGTKPTFSWSGYNRYDLRGAQSNIFALNVERLVAFTLNQTTGKSALYIDGVEEWASASLAPGPTGKRGIELGCYKRDDYGPTYDINPLDGTIRDFAIFDRILTPAELIGITNGSITYETTTPPEIDSFDPVSGLPGSTFDILTESGPDVSAVNFDGAPVAGWTNESDRVSGVEVPAGGPGSFPVTIETDGGESDPVNFERLEPIPPPPLPGPYWPRLGSLVEFLVDSYTPQTFLPKAEVVGADGLRIVRERLETPVRYVAQVVLRLNQDKFEEAAAYFAGLEDSVVEWESDIRIFGQETGDGPLNCRLWQNSIRGERLGFDDYRLDLDLVLEDPVVIDPGEIDLQALETIPWNWSHPLTMGSRVKTHRTTSGDLSTTWDNSAPIRTTLSADLTLEELAEVRKFYFHGVGAGSFALAMNAPIFGEAAGYSHQARIVNFRERRSSARLRSVQIELEKVG